MKRNALILLFCIMSLFISLAYSASFENLTVNPYFFSPNGDGIRDKVYIKFTPSESCTLAINLYNPIGMFLFAYPMNYDSLQGEVTFPFDGKDTYNEILPDGVYPFEITGETLNSDAFEPLSGFIRINNGFIKITNPEPNSILTGNNTYHWRADSTDVQIIHDIMIHYRIKGETTIHPLSYANRYTDHIFYFDVDTTYVDNNDYDIISECHFTDVSGEERTEYITPTSYTVSNPFELTILSPENDSTTNKNQVLIQGSVDSNMSMSQVTVNGVVADSTDSFKNWSIELPLTEGLNTFTVIATSQTGLQKQSNLIVHYNPLAKDAVIELIQPNESQIIQGHEVKITGTSQYTQEIKINDQPARIGANGDFIFDRFPLQSGDNQIKIISKSIDNIISQQTITVISKPKTHHLKIDDFEDADHESNQQGYWTSDNQTLIENIEVIENENKIKKLTWDNTEAFWYSSLWDHDTNPQGSDLSQFDLLSFKIKGAQGGENFTIEIEDIPHSENFSSKSLLNEHVTLTTSWQEVNIALNSISHDGLWKTQTRSLVFLFDQMSSGTIFIDDIKLKSGLIDHFSNNNISDNDLGNLVEEQGSIQNNEEQEGYRTISWNNTDAKLIQHLENSNEYYNASSFEYLSLRLRGHAGGENFSITLRDFEKISTVTLAESLTTEYQRVFIPLSNFNVDSSKLKSIQLAFNTQQTGTIDIDQLMLTNTFHDQTQAISNGPVQIINKHLFVEESPFQIKGIGYQPTPIGDTPDSSTDLYQNLELIQRDLPHLQEIGTNTIRTWKTLNSTEFLDQVYNNGINPIYVLMGFHIEHDLDLSNPAIRQNIKNEFSAFVLNYKDHPAVLMWALGNEYNLDYSGDLSDWYSLANELGEISKNIEGAAYHPVMIVNYGLKNLGQKNIHSDDQSLHHIDVWGVNSYRGYSYKGFFESYHKLSSKPLVITEYGADAWHTQSQLDPSIGYEDQVSQKNHIINNYTEIKQAPGVLGSYVMSYCDEWFKDIGHNYDTHDYGGSPLRIDQPDQYVNEEWWGLFSVNKNPVGGVDVLVPRDVVSALKNAFHNTIVEINDETPPEDITHLNGAEGDEFIELSWVKSINSNEDAVSQKIYLDFGQGFELYDEIDFNQTNYTLSSLTNNHSYTIKITVIDESGNESQGVSITLPPIDLVPPHNVENFTITQGDSLLNLNWTDPDPSPDLLEYRIYISPDYGGSNPTTLSKDSTSHELSGLTNNVKYICTIKSVDDDSNESDGVSASGIPQSNQAPKITIISPQNELVTNMNQITIEGHVDHVSSVLKINETIYPIDANGDFIASSVVLNNEDLNIIRITAEYNGYTGETELLIVKDQTLPELFIIYPKDGSTVNGHL